jgi:hypothetical protein
VGRDAETGRRSIDVSDTVYLLWFVQERDEAKDTELLIGVYAAETDAIAAIPAQK